MSVVSLHKPIPTPRKPSFPCAGRSMHWIPNDPYASQMFNAFSLFLPPGELMFCRVFQAALPYIDDPTLKAEVRAFIRQEAAHARAHDDAADGLLEQQGIDTQAVTRWVEWLVRQGPLAEKPFGYTIPAEWHRSWVQTAAGIVAAIEHITCFMGRFMLENSSWEADGADPVVAGLLKWHGAEEVEHRCVAFDVYEALDGGYGQRVALAVFGLPLLLSLSLWGAGRIMDQDPAIAASMTKPWRLGFWKSWRRSARKGHMPKLGWLVREQLRYFDPRYNPINEGDSRAALRWLNTHLFPSGESVGRLSLSSDFRRTP